MVTSVILAEYQAVLHATFSNRFKKNYKGYKSYRKVTCKTA